MLSRISPIMLKPGERRRRRDRPSIAVERHQFLQIREPVNVLGPSRQCQRDHGDQR